MKKIIAAFDGLKYQEATAKYALHLTRLANAHLVGVFLEDFTYHSLKIDEIAESGELLVHRLKVFDEKDKQTRKQSVEHFERTCQEAGVNYSVHHDRNIALQDLLHESVFADLLVVNSNETMTHYDEAPPARFLKDLLVQVRCPVVIVPREYEPLDQLILLYYGTPASVNAIKGVSYLLPLLKTFETEVLSVKNVKEDAHLQDNHLFREFMKRHFPNAIYSVRHGNPAAEIVTHVIKKDGNPLVVLGAYQRGMVSRWLKMSMADILIQELDVPLFIAHQ